MAAKSPPPPLGYNHCHSNYGKIGFYAPYGPYLGGENLKSIKF